jgi:hypothetical protein
MSAAESMPALPETRSLFLIALAAAILLVGMLIRFEHIASKG